MTLIAEKLTKNRFIYQQEIIKHSYRIRKQDMNAFKEENRSQIDWRDVLLTDDIDASCKSFVGTINRIKDKYIKTFKMDSVRVTYPGLMPTCGTQ